MYAFCFLSAVPMRAQATHRAEMVNQLLFGDQLEVVDRQSEWLFVRSLYDGYEGWVSSKQLALIDHPIATDFVAAVPCQVTLPASVGFALSDPVITLPIGGTCCADWLAEPVESNEVSPIAVARRFLNAPYLWGGRTVLGVDCSGLVQVAHKVCGIQLPRDASQQAQVGKRVGYDELREGDLAFFAEEDRIVHVGICMGERQILHASGRVRIDSFVPEGIVDVESGDLTHRFHSIRRLV